MDGRQARDERSGIIVPSFFQYGTGFLALRGLLKGLPDDRRTSEFPSLDKEGWREAPGWFAMSVTQVERRYPMLLMPQRFNRVHLRGAPGREVAKDHPDAG